MLRVRDCVVLVIVLLTIYHTTIRPNSWKFYLELDWFIEVDRTVVRSDDSIRAIDPIITDLDNDGRKELLFVDFDGNLKLYKIENIFDHDSKDIYHPEQIPAMELTDQNILSLAVANNPENQGKQLVVVITKALSLMCYNHKMQLLWSTSVKSVLTEENWNQYNTSDYHTSLKIHNIEDNDEKRRSSAAIIMSISSITPNDEEIVHIVSLNASTGDLLWKNTLLTSNKHDYEPVKDGNDSNIVGKMHKFSMDMLDGLSGFNDRFEQELVSSDAQRRLFYSSFLAQLPHKWNNLYDTKISIDHFSRNAPRRPKMTANSVSARRRSKVRSELAKKIGSKTAIYSETSQQRTLQRLTSKTINKNATVSKNASHNFERIARPRNVVIVRHSRGLSALTLVGGKLISQMKLPSNSLLVDLNHDGIIDSISFQSDNEQYGHSSGSEYGVVEKFHPDHSQRLCKVVVKTGLPARTQLFNATICGKEGQNVFTQGKMNNHAELIEGNSVKVENKIAKNILPFALGIAFSLQSDNEVVHHWKADHGIIVATREGKLISFSKTGEKLWQTTTNSLWRNDHLSQEKSRDKVVVLQCFNPISDDADGEVDYVSEDNTYSCKINPFTHIVVMGEDHVTLVAVAHTHSVSEVELPHHAVLPPIVSDFNNDGINDLIIVTNGNIVGLRGRFETLGFNMAIALVISMLIAAVVFMSSIKANSSKKQSGVNDKKSWMMAAKYLHVQRSTDDLHID